MKLSINFNNEHKSYQKNELLHFSNNLCSLLSGVYLAPISITFNISFTGINNFPFLNSGCIVEAAYPINFNVIFLEPICSQNFSFCEPFREKIYFGFFYNKVNDNIDVGFDANISKIDLMFKIVSILEKEIPNVSKNKAFNINKLINSNLEINDSLADPSFFSIIDNFFIDIEENKSFIKENIGIDINDLPMFILSLKNLYLDMLNKHDFFLITKDEFKNFNYQLNMDDLIDKISSDVKILNDEFIEKYQKNTEIFDFYEQETIYQQLQSYSNRIINYKGKYKISLEDALIIKSILITEEIPIREIDRFMLPNKSYNLDSNLRFTPYFIEVDDNLYEKINKITTTPKTINFFDKIYYGNSGTGKTHLISEEIKEQKHYINTYSINMFGDENQLFIAILESIIVFITEQVYLTLEIYHEKYARDLMVLRDYKKYNHIFIDEFNRGNFIKKLSHLFYIFDRNESGFSNSKNVDISIYKQKIKELLLRITKPLKEVYPACTKINLDGSNRNEYTRLLAYVKNDLTNKNKYLNDEINFYFNLISSVIESENLEIPNEFPIFATPNLKFTLCMNTVDINVEQLDLMFNRRFSFIYMPYNLDENVEKKQYYIIDGDKKINWGTIQKILNNIIGINFHESKCIGYYFWNKDVIKFDEFKNKISFYLYYTVLSNADPLSFQFNMKDNKGNMFFREILFEKIMNSKNIEELFNKNIVGQIFKKPKAINKTMQLQKR